MRVNWPFIAVVLGVPAVAIGMYYGLVAAAVYVISRTDVTSVILTR